MYRIDNATAVGSIPTPGPVGPNPDGYFSDGVTVLPADWLNAVQEEIAYVVEQTGATLDKTDRTQLKDAIDSYILAAPGRVLARTLIQGSVEDELSTSPGYIDSADVVEDNVSYNGTLSYSIDDAAGATSSNWLSVFPITKPSNVNKTEIRLFQMSAGSGVAGEEDHANGVIVIDWENARVNGWMAGNFGKGYQFQACYRFSGAISAGSNDYTGTLQNGSYASGGSAPTFRVDGTAETITRLPMFGILRNVGFEILHYS